MSKVPKYMHKDMDIDEGLGEDPESKVWSEKDRDDFVARSVRAADTTLSLLPYEIKKLVTATRLLSLIMEVVDPDNTCGLHRDGASQTLIENYGDVRWRSKVVAIVSRRAEVKKRMLELVDELSEVLGDFE